METDWNMDVWKKSYCTKIVIWNMTGSTGRHYKANRTSTTVRFTHIKHFQKIYIISFSPLVDWIKAKWSRRRIYEDSPRHCTSLWLPVYFVSKCVNAVSFIGDTLKSLHDFDNIIKKIFVVFIKKSTQWSLKNNLLIFKI